MIRLILVGFLLSGCGGPSISEKTDFVFAQKRMSISGLRFSKADSKEEEYPYTGALSIDERAKNKPFRAEFSIATQGRELISEHAKELTIIIDGEKHVFPIIKFEQESIDIYKKTIFSDVFVSVYSYFFDIQLSLLEKIRGSNLTLLEIKKIDKKNLSSSTLQTITLELEKESTQKLNEFLDIISKKGNAHE